MQGGLIKCSSSFGNVWILVFSLLPCVCVCLLQCWNYLTLRCCLFGSLRYSLVCFAACITLLFALQPCLCLEKSTTGFSKFVYEYGN